ncbi:hypothetical protein KBC04_04600 [Candidatus Babeliales bacterium]|nr:hypothetical protein [Candidatus Babeliales bacterium]MBP9844101.1 hypothetical protein [Candidatus Babeliales bacterium]
MKKRLSIKDLLHASWKNFIEHFMDWLMLFGVQLIVLFGFFICCAASLALAYYFFVELCLFKCALSGYSKLFTVATISIISVVSLFFMVIFPIMYKQNALDLVFNRTMSGFDVNNRFFSYAVAMFVYWMVVMIASCFGFLPGLFLAQRWRFVGLHLLYHGGSVREAFRSSWHMTRGYIWFLVGVSIIQWVIFSFCSPTLVLIVLAIALNRLIDANMYKQLHIEDDKNILLCSCES